MEESSRPKITRGAEPGTESETFAGLPTGRTAALPIPGAPEVEDRRNYDTERFTLPKRLLPPSWKRPDEDRRFAMVLINTEQEKRAIGAAGQSQNFGAAYGEMLGMVIVEIGGVNVRNRRSDVMQWLDDVGPKCRKLVDAAFNKLMSVSEADIASFLDGTDVEE